MTTNEQNTFILNQEKFTKFLNDEFTVKEVKLFGPEIEERFDYIVKKIAEITNRNVEWYDFDNEGNNEDSPGFFDTEEYSKNVHYVGGFNNLTKIRFKNYDDAFPTSWFYTNFEESLKNEQKEYFSKLEENKKSQEDKAIIIKQKHAKIQESIKSKLTKEELSHITFKVKI